MYSVVVSAQADDDLDAILAYFVGKLGNREAAIRFVDAVDGVYDNLARYPMMYGLSFDGRLAEKGYRSVVIENHIMLYKVDEDHRRVLVARFFYGKRDYGKYL